MVRMYNRSELYIQIDIHVPPEVYIQIFIDIYIGISLGGHNLGTFYARKLKFDMLFTQA